MDKEIKAKWIEALRSGKYKQGRSMLKDRVSNAFCCLGVLCDITNPDGWSPYKANEKAEEDEYYTYHADALSSCEFAPDSKLRKLFSDEENVHLGVLIGMNDDMCNKKSFSDIADYIEKNL